MFKMCVAGGGESVGRVCIGFFFIGHWVVITLMLCVVLVSKKGIVPPSDKRVP